jgi:hypothetical protein
MDDRRVNLCRVTEVAWLLRTCLVATMCHHGLHPRSVHCCSDNDRQSQAVLESARVRQGVRATQPDHCAGTDPSKRRPRTPKRPLSQQDVRKTAVDSCIAVPNMCEKISTSPRPRCERVFNKGSPTCNKVPKVFTSHHSHSTRSDMHQTQAQWRCRDRRKHAAAQDCMETMPQPALCTRPRVQYAMHEPRPPAHTTGKLRCIQRSEAFNVGRLHV